MLIVIIPIGGIGQRFKDHQFPFPKSLTLVQCKPILFYLIDNIITHQQKPSHIIIPYHNEYQEYLFEQQIKHTYPGINFIFLPLQYNTLGAAHTIYLGLSHIKQLNIPDSPFISFDSDSFYKQDILKLWDKKNTIFYTNDSGNIPQYSYIKINDKNNTIDDIQEKKSITKNACTGTYAFDSYQMFLKHFELYIQSIKNNNEIYVSQIIKFMISNKIKFYSQFISSNNWICLGTPQQVLSYCNTHSPNTTMRICYDLDNTLVTFPT